MAHSYLITLIFNIHSIIYNIKDILIINIYMYVYIFTINIFFFYFEWYEQRI